jgi:sulfite reductase alpha subunit-like flavoprotein
VLFNFSISQLNHVFVFLRSYYDRPFTNPAIFSKSPQFSKLREEFPEARFSRRRTQGNVIMCNFQGYFWEMLVVECEVEWQVCPRLQPRQFSIACSLAAHPREAHITLAVVDYRTPYKRRKQGLCSTWLAKLTPGKNRALIDSFQHIVYPPTRGPLIRGGSFLVTSLVGDGL